MTKSLYVVNHWDRYGPTSYMVKCNHVPTVGEVVQALGLEIEPNNKKSVTIEAILPSEIKDIPD